jgi:hypothetical protein
MSLGEGLFPEGIEFGWFLAVRFVSPELFKWKVEIHGFSFFLPAPRSWSSGFHLQLYNRERSQLP